MMNIAATAIHSAIAIMFGSWGYSSIVSAGYGFWAGLIGFVCGVAVYAGILACLALSVVAFLEWLDNK
jgi:hypothetical protein